MRRYKVVCTLNRNFHASRHKQTSESLLKIHLAQVAASEPFKVVFDNDLHSSLMLFLSVLYIWQSPAIQ
jgi:hypothetical protein